MNRSRYVSRPIDNVDRAIIAELAQNGRMTVRELATRIGMSSPSTAERIHKLEDAGAIAAYTISTDPRAFGLETTAHVRLRAMPGEVKRLAQMLVDAPEVVEADRVTGDDCFVAKVVVRDVHELEAVIDRFVPARRVVFRPRPFCLNGSPGRAPLNERRTAVNGPTRTALRTLPAWHADDPPLCCAIWTEWLLRRAV